MKEYEKVMKTYPPTYLWDSSDSSDSRFSSDSSDSSDRSDSSDSSDQRTFFTQKITKNVFFYIFFKLLFTKKLKNSNCNETQKI